MEDIRRKSITIYTTKDGKQPFVKWFTSFKDIRIKDRIKKRIDRVKLGNYGDYKNVGKAVFELRLHFGKGYRIYFAEDGKEIVLLFSGGDKETQQADIKAALGYWRDYHERKK